MMKNDEFNNLLKSSLKSETAPSNELNIALKRQIRINASEKTISLWYLPLILSAIFSIMLISFTFLFIPSLLVKLTLVGTSLFLVTNATIFTLVGLHSFDLRNGAVIKL